MNAINTLPAETSAAPGTSMMDVAASQPLTPMQMAYQLIAMGRDIAAVEKMLDMSDRLAKDQARRAFDAAVAEAKAEIQPVAKNKKGHTGRYADFAAIASAVDPIISKHGLSYRFRTEQSDRIKVTCILSHKDGHSEETALAGPPDTSGSKNAIQAIGSTLTYLQRYTLVQALGLAASDDDDGKASGTGEAISEEQLAELRELIDATNSDIERFCKYFKIDALPDLPAAQFERAIASLKAKAKK